MRDYFPDPNELICGAVDGTRKEEENDYNVKETSNETRDPYDSVDKIDISYRKSFLGYFINKAGKAVMNKEN